VRDGRSERFFRVAAVLPYVIALLAVIAMALMFLSVRHAREVKANGRRGGSAPGPPEAAVLERLPSRTLPQSMRLASLQLQRLVAGGSGVYEVPWVVAVGAGSADLDRLLPEQLPWPPDLAGAHQAVLGQVGRISFCRTGAVLGFDDGLLDGPEWRQRWHSLVRALQTCRPGRPVDGLVVVIRASELRGSQESQDRLVARSDQIYHLIWSVQRMTGWRIPVYLLVSGCEELTGFADWVLALPRQARQQVLGWSVPYALDSVFEPKWVDEGIAEVGRQLSVAQLLLMMPEPEVGVAEGLLLFPGEAQRLAAPLSVLLTGMLRTSAYHEAFMFRGFFLAGRVPGAVAQEARSDAFAEALFTEKVFPEHRLAQPAYGEATRRHRQIRIAQVAFAAVAVLCLIGVMHIQRVKSDYLPPVYTLLSQIGQQVSARALQRDNPQVGAARRERVRDVALRLLNAMAAIQIDRIDTIAAPTSLLSFANSRVEQAIAAGYSVAVLEAAYDALTEKPGLVAILEPAPPPGAPAPTSRQALSTTVDRILEYDRYVSVYERISAQPSIGDVAELMKYALNVQLPADFTTNYGLYEHALSSAHMRQIEMPNVQPIIEQILQDRDNAAIEDAFTGNALKLSVTKLASLADTATQGSLSVDTGRKLLADTQTTLDTISSLLKLPSYDWLSNKPGSASPLPPLDKLKDVRVVRPDFIAGLLAAGAKAEVDTRNWLLHATAFDRALVLVSSDGAVTLSPAMDASHRLLNDLFSQPFMRSVPAAGTPATPAPGTRINWDVQTLRQAEDLAESFLAFAPKEDATLPQSIQQQVRSVAGAEAAAHIGLLLRLAARPAADLPNGGSRAMLQEVSGLANALPVLVNLRNTLRQAGATAQAGALDALVSGQAVRLLRQVDNNLAAAAPYRLADPNLSFWHGSPPLAEPAFGASSPTDLASTLPPRRDFVETLARDYAAPLVSYLRDPGTAGSAAAAGLVARWQSILDTLDRYHRSDPSNSLTRLEQFITVDMDKIDLSNCRQLTAGGGMAGDYFAEQLQNIRRTVSSRCGTVVHTGTIDRYTSLATSFNAQLAGRFPFAPVAGFNSAAGGAALGAADPNQVRRFLLDYGPDLPALQAQFQSGGSRGAAEGAAEVFLTQLLAVQTAFAPMLADPSGNTPLSYQVDIEFFTNPGAARAQNQVINASVIAGNQRASSMSGTSRIVWTNGQPLRVELLWATNAPMVPDETVHKAWPRIGGLSAGFDFGGNWALLSLLRAQAPSSADLNALQDRRPGVVEFDVPLKRNPNAATGGDAEVDTARVYMRLALTGVLQAPGQPEKTLPIALPEFPTAAPLLGRTMSSVGRQTSAAPIPLVTPTARSASP
jgi:type VI secretion system protein ImpL